MPRQPRDTDADSGAWRFVLLAVCVITMAVIAVAAVAQLST